MKYRVSLLRCFLQFQLFLTRSFGYSVDLVSTFVPFILRGTKESRGRALKKPNVQSGRVSFITVKVHKADTDISYLYRISKGVMLLGLESEDGATNEP